VWIVFRYSPQRPARICTGFFEDFLNVRERELTRRAARLIKHKGDGSALQGIRKPVEAAICVFQFEIWSGAPNWKLTHLPPEYNSPTLRLGGHRRDGEDRCVFQPDGRSRCIRFAPGLRLAADITGSRRNGPGQVSPAGK